MAIRGSPAKGVDRGDRCVGSNPTFRATSPQVSQACDDFLFHKKRIAAHKFNLLLLSAKGHARIFCSLVNALATKISLYQPFAGSSLSTLVSQKVPIESGLFHFPFNSGVNPLSFYSINYINDDKNNFQRSKGRFIDKNILDTFLKLSDKFQDIICNNVLEINKSELIKVVKDYIYH